MWRCYYSDDDRTDVEDRLGACLAGNGRDASQDSGCSDLRDVGLGIVS
jgi:hypothetical protein